MVYQPLQSQRFLKIENQLRIRLNLDFKSLGYWSVSKPQDCCFKKVGFGQYSEWEEDDINLVFLSNADESQNKIEADYQALS